MFLSTKSCILDRFIFKKIKNMNYKSEEFDDYLIVSLEGQYIGGEETDKLSVFFKPLTKNNKNKIIVDLAKVTYISSIVLGLFVKLHNELTNEGGYLLLINVNPIIMEIFKITRVDLNLYIFKNLSEATSFLKKVNK